jgi:hypothetical protein
MIPRSEAKPVIHNRELSIYGQESHYGIAPIMGGLYGDGIIGLKGAFPRDWVAQLGEDINGLYKAALQRPGGAVGRGRNRHYVEIHPEMISGFVEIGFDVPSPGSLDQPWHRDFPAPEETLTGRRLNSLAFNLTTVDVFEEMGPFEIAPGTQWDYSLEFQQGMFPPQSFYSRYEKLAQRKLPKMGDISVRSALTIHRGTANRSDKARPVLVVGVDAPDARNSERHDLQVTSRCYEELPEELKEHLTCRLVDELEPIVQGHTIEGLMMGEF